MTSRKKHLSNRNVASIVSAVVGNTVQNTTTPGNRGFLFRRERVPVETIFARIGPQLFRRCYRMSESLFWKLHSLLEPYLSKDKSYSSKTRTPNGDIYFDLPGHGKDYIHRVGRTARAGKSGKAIAMVTQYDVEVYQRLEGLLGKKLPEYKLDEETVLVLLERVNEAQRLATRELKEQLAASKQSGRRKRKSDGGDDDEGMEGSLQKEIKKGYFAGGSGGRGGALPNQRGSGRQTKKYKHHR